MPVNVIGTLKPKNNGKFPVAEAVDIKVTDDLRLDEALENKADLETIDFALNNKADKATTNSLQSQINEIITPVTQDAEVQNARVGADGTSYTTLKARLDAENVDLIEELDYIGTEVGIIRKRIRNATIDANGIIVSGNYDLVCFYNEFARNVNELRSDSSFVYAYYSNEPALNSQSYNSSRRASDVNTVSDLPLPSTAKWIVARCTKNGTVSIEYDEKRGLSKNNFTDAEKAKVDAIPENPQYTDTVYDDTAIRNDINYIEDKIGIVKKRIKNASIDTNGEIISGTFDLICFYNQFAKGIDLLKSDAAFPYAYYANEPDIGSVSYNGLRRFSETDSATDLTIPSVAKWVVARCNKNSNVEITYDHARSLSENDYTDADKAKVTAIPANPKYTDTIYDDTAVKSNIKNMSEYGIFDYDITLDWVQGRFTLDNGAVVYDESTKFCRTDYIDISELGITEPFYLYIPEGYDVYGRIFKNTSDTYDNTKGVGDGWNEGQTIVEDNRYNEVYKYIMLNVKRSDGQDISLSELNGISLYYEKKTKSQTDIETLERKLNVHTPTGGQILYKADDKVSSGYIVNAVAYSDGVIIACRSDGTVVRIGYSGTEEILLTIDGTGTDWRCCYMDKNENVYVSPHASWGSMTMTERGLYKLEKGANAFTKVLSFDNSTPHDDTIWTMCEDNDGYMYAGTYCHLIRFQPRIYRSSDNGDTWEVIVDFTNSPVISGGRHIHSIIYSKYQDALYTIVGEVNTILKSSDNGVTWENLNVALTVKGSAMLALPQGIVIGSDGAYNCDIDILYNDDKTHRKIYRGWANTVFAIRISDITGFIYVFTKIDSSVNSTDYYPPITVLDGTTTIEEWQESVSTTTYNNWKSYHDSVADKYPDDAIRPQHYSILVSRDGGMTFEVLKAFETTSERANGIWTIGYFRNGECLCGCFDNGITNPIVISEGKHKYVEGGCDLTGEIFVRTNTSSIASIL